VPPKPVTSGFAPLKIPVFRDRWIASTVSSIGTWMQDAAGTWLMTTLTASPLLIALMPEVENARSELCISLRIVSPFHAASPQTLATVLIKVFRNNYILG